MTRYAMVMDQRRCIGCSSCTIACRTWNELPIDVIYNPVVQNGAEGVWPHVHMTFSPLICMHCDKPACVPACPTGASRQDEDGIVWVEPSQCMACKVCANACPYGARVMNEEEGYIRKCTFCKGSRSAFRPATKRHVPSAIWMTPTARFPSSSIRTTRSVSTLSSIPSPWSITSLT